METSPYLRITVLWGHYGCLVEWSGVVFLMCKLDGNGKQWEYLELLRYGIQALTSLVAVWNGVASWTQLGRLIVNMKCHYTPHPHFWEFVLRKKWVRVIEFNASWMQWSSSIIIRKTKLTKYMDCDRTDIKKHFYNCFFIMSILYRLAIHPSIQF